MPSNAVNFAINGTTLTYQPSGISEIWPETSVYTTLSGSRIVVEPSAGPIIEVIWGVESARSDVVSELRTKRPSSGSVTISYINATSGTSSYTTYMPKIPYEQFLMTNMISQLALQFYTLAP